MAREEREHAAAVAIGILAGILAVAFVSISAWNHSVAGLVASWIYWGLLVVLGYYGEEDERRERRAVAVARPSKRVVNSAVLLERDGSLLLVCGHSIDLTGAPSYVRECMTSQSSVPCGACSLEKVEGGDAA